MDHAFNEINNIITSIPGNVCRPRLAEFLFQLSRATKGIGEVVEIGTNVGKSAIALAYGQKIKNGKPIFSIDIYQHQEVQKNLENAGVTDYVTRIVQPSHLAAKKWSLPIELLWIDGDHSYRGVCTDIKNWAPFVQVGGLIAFHDYPGHRRSQEVSKALRKHLFRHPYQYRVISDREVDSAIVFQKLPVQTKPIPTTRKIKKQFYWLYRNARSIAVYHFPRLARYVKESRQ